jgi:hypothetical protein
LHTLVLWRLAVVVGYVSERHVLLLVLCGTFAGAAMTALIGKRIGEVVYGIGPHVWPSLIALLGLTAFGLPETFKPLHANRAGHRAAGFWLAQNSDPADPIVDPFCWAHFYAGRVFLEGKDVSPPTGHQLTQYVVLERSDHDHVHLPTIQYALDLAKHGQPVYWWPEKVPEEQAKVCVYAVGGN